MTDSDTQWHDKFGGSESPAEFNIRWQDRALTEAEIEAVSGCSSAADAFAILYPDYVTLDAWRHRPAPALAPEPEPEIVEEVSEAITLETDE